MPDWSPLPNPVEVGGEEWRLAVAAELRDMRMSLEAFGEGLGRLEVRVDALASEIETHTTYHDTDDGAVMPPSGTTIGPLVHSNETRHTPSAFEPEVYDSRLGYATTTLTDGERQVEEIRARLEDLQDVGLEEYVRVIAYDLAQLQHHVERNARITHEAESAVMERMLPKGLRDLMEKAGVPSDGVTINA